jgi:hypothetical protein
MDALGNLFDVGIGWSPVDLDTANGATGKRVNMTMHETVTFLVVQAAGAATDATLTLKQHTAYTSGTSNNLASATVSTSYGITYWHIKSEAVLDGDEAWTKVTQSEAATISLTGATYGDKETILALEVHRAQLGDGYTHISLDHAATLGAAKLGTCLIIPSGLRYRRKPASLFNMLRGNATANA